MRFLIKILVSDTPYIEEVKAKCEEIDGVKEVKVVPEADFVDHEVEVIFEGANFEALLVRRFIATQIDHIMTAIDPEEIKE